MPVINLVTFIQAPVERVFDLSLSIEAHTAGVATTGERAIAGVTSGLIGFGEQVTWEARHLGVRQKLTVRIVKLERPKMFEDQMISGAFKSMRHVHEFTAVGSGTELTDVFRFEAPLGILGWLAERLFLTRYMTRFLQMRNAALKQLAESNEWQRFLPRDQHRSG